MRNHRNGGRAGEENLFLFGLTVEEVANSQGWYDRIGTMNTIQRRGPLST